MKTLKLILGDQLNYKHSWFDSANPNHIFVMMEILPESQYVRHHIQKIVGFFLAMRAFAEAKQAEGHQFIYFKLDDANNQQSFEKNILQIIVKESIEKFEYLLPDEYRLDILLKKFAESLTIPLEVSDTEHFLTKREDLAEFFKGKKTYLLENFYRKMRQKHHILMEADGKEPLTGQWNFDAENRKKYDKKIPIPKSPNFNHQVSEIVEMIQKANIQTIGRIEADNFEWCVSRNEALVLLDFFVKNCLKAFGTYEDAMEINEPFLFHSKLSFAMNTKMLHPLEVVGQAVEHWQKNQTTITIAQIEGFVRQIIGWREYMRGVYWAKMPEYASLNYFEHQSALPDFFWTGKTKMNCLHQSINQALDHAYNHHIQRLMVMGNFALLAGVHPDAVDEWYLGIYIDAIEWVEITNTRGMSQFADGGLVGSKPYVSSANYMDKMSSYCSKCHYDKKKKTGDKACPFNSLYWHFYERHRDKLEKNPRIGMMYQTLKKMNEEDKNALMQQAYFYLKNINQL